MDRRKFGRRVNIARKDRGLTSEKLAELCNINATYLRQIESGAKTPSLPMFITICRELRVSPNYLLPDLVIGTESEYLQKFNNIFAENDPSPSQIEVIEEVVRAILKER